ncbi:hypothetical protein ABK040_016725 [Willaertia magna]
MDGDFITNFEIPINPQDLEKETDKSFYVDEILDVNTFNSSESHSFLDETDNKLNDKPYAITNKEIFVTIYSYIHHFGTLNDSAKIRLVDILTSNLTSLLTSITNIFFHNSQSQSGDDFDHVVNVHKNALKMLIFCLYWVITKYEKEEIETTNESAAGKKKTRNKKRRKSVIEMDSWKERIIEILCATLKHDLASLWKREKAEDAFVLLFFKTAFTMMENPENLKSATVKEAIFRLIITALQVTSDSLQTVVSSILHMIMTSEHMVTCIVDMIELIVRSSAPLEIAIDSNSSVGKLFVSELFREIGRLDNDELNKDTTGTKYLSLFITEMGERLPQTILANMSVVISHLNDESYQIRNSIIHSISRVVATVLITSSTENNSRNTTSENLTKKTRDQLLGILEERVQDVNAYTRSKVIQCWSYLCEEKAIPLNVLPKVVDLVIGRLYDKSAFVRKAAVNFLKSILEFNPYGGDLRLTLFKEKLEEAKKYLESIPKLTETEKEIQLESEREEEQGRRQASVKLCLFFKEAIRFVEQMHETIPSTCQLLNSKTSSDVIECIEFFVKSYNFKLEASVIGLKRSLKLIWSPETSVRDATSEAIQSIFMDLNKLTNASMCIEVAKQFAEFVIGCTKSEISALECIVNMTVLKDKFPKVLFLALWELISDQYSDYHSIGAMIILGMIASARPEAIRRKLKTLISDGLGERSEKSPILATYAFSVLQKLSMDDSSEAFKENEKKKKGDDDEMLKYAGGNKNFKLANDHKLFKIIVDRVIDSEQKVNLNDWVIFTESALNCLFSLCEQPEQLAHHIIKEISVKTNIGKDNNSEETNAISISTHELTKLLFLLGHCSLRELVHIEQLFKKAKKISAKAVTKPALPEKKRRGRKKKEDAQKRGREEYEEDQETTAIEQELGFSNLDDHVLEEAFEEKEKGIITDKTIYGSYLPLILNICCDNSNMYKYSLLRKTAILTLCKYMCVSQEVCDSNMRLIFSILLKTPEILSKQAMDGYASIRNNIIVSIGDLACRFPNSVERYIHHLYSCLRDKDSRVRKNTLLVLSHLVLNDMVKVKSNIFEIVRCIEDSNEEISQMSKSFFTELSKKSSGNNNPIYNLLPTILSNLSHKSADISAESFQNIMKFLISFVTKVQHNEKLVKKLCQRFDLVCIASSTSTVNNGEVYEQLPQDEDLNEYTKQSQQETSDEITKTDVNADTIQQWRNLAYCLTQLTFNDKCVQILLSEECLKSYKKALMDYEVYEYLSCIPAKYKKNASGKGKKANSELGVLSNELKEAIDEWEKQIKTLHIKLSEENGLMSKFQRDEADDGSEDEDNGEIKAKKLNRKGTTNSSKQSKKSTRKGRGRRAKDYEEEEDSAEETEEEEIDMLFDDESEDEKEESDLELFDEEEEEKAKEKSPKKGNSIETKEADESAVQIVVSEEEEPPQETVIRKRRTSRRKVSLNV